MPKLEIDNRRIIVDSGATILEAAEMLGIHIPTMCFLKGYTPSTSCMVCVVKVEGINSLVPSCGMAAKDGMKVETCGEEIYKARQAALELLLSDHIGDCIAPCRMICPAGMNIPLMTRQIKAGKLKDAIITVKRDIALPGVLGWICPSPCEKGCRRAKFDEAVSICMLHRYVAEVELSCDKPYVAQKAVPKNKRVAIIGAGPAGLATAYYLLQKGYTCNIYDKNDKPGGALRYSECSKKFPLKVLDAETASIERLGFEFHGKMEIGSNISFEEVRQKYDAVFVAVGEITPFKSKYMGLETGRNGIKIDKAYQTSFPGVFAGGDAVRRRRLTVRSVADGKEAAAAIDQFLSGQDVTGEENKFSSHVGQLKEGEIENFVLEVSRSPRVNVETSSGFTESQAREESARCLHCDCRKAENCRLKDCSQEYHASPNRFRSERKLFSQQVQHYEIIYEPGKCIKCGLCIQIASEEKERSGLTFIGRGFDVKVAVPFDKSIAEGLTHTAGKCVSACPTGALSFKDHL